MTIYYSLISRGTTILCSNQIGAGNFETVARSMLPNIPTRSDTKTTYTASSCLFHVIVENGLIYLCATAPDFSRIQSYGFLGEIKAQFDTSGLVGRGQFADERELDGEFSSTLATHMERYSRPSGGGGDQVSQLRAQVDEVKGVMSQNIERVLERGERLEDLMDKTEDLEVHHSATPTMMYRAATPGYTQGYDFSSYYPYHTPWTSGGFDFTHVYHAQTGHSGFSNVAPASYEGYGHLLTMFSTTRTTPTISPCADGVFAYGAGDVTSSCWHRSAAWPSTGDSFYTTDGCSYTEEPPGVAGARWDPLATPFQSYSVAPEYSGYHLPPVQTPAAAVYSSTVADVAVVPADYVTEAPQLTRLCRLSPPPDISTTPLEKEPPVCLSLYPDLSTNTAPRRVTEASDDKEALPPESAEKTTKVGRRRRPGRPAKNIPLGQEALKIMTLWFDRNYSCPYPTQAEKRKLAADGGITVTQVTAWFANRRSRSGNTKPQREKRKLTETISHLSQAQTFKKSARQVHKKMWWSNMKMKLIIGGIVLVILVVIILIILGSTGVFNPKPSPTTKPTTPKP